MDLLIQIILFGFIAFGCFVSSVVFLAFTTNKRPIVGLAFGVLELIFGALSSAVWAYALKISGKIDWFLLGLLGYPPIALIFYTMLLVGVVCIGINLRHIIKQKINVTDNS